MLVMVLSVSLTLPYLGAERFGIWMTVASFAGMLTFLDLGVGNALTNRVASTASLNNATLLREAISGGLGLLILWGFAISTALMTIAYLIPWTNIIKVNNPSLYGEIKQAGIMFSALFGLNLITSGIQRIFAGIQEAYRAHLVSTLGSLLALFLLWLASKQQADIPILLLVTLGSQSCASILLLALLVKRKQFTMIGIKYAIDKEKKPLLDTGILFFILQVGTMVGWGADNLIISSTLGATHVAVYNITQRLFQFVSQPLAIINAPLWGAYCDAQSRNDKNFIRKTLKTSIFLTVIISTTGGLLIFSSSSWIINLWTEGKITVPNLLLILFFILTICESLGNSFAMFLNGCNIIKPQVVFVIILSFISLPAKLIFTSKYGISGLTSSWLIVYTTTILITYALLFKKYINEKLK